LEHHWIFDPCGINNVLLLKIEGPVWYTIYHHLTVVKGVTHTSLLINQPMGKVHLCVALFLENMMFQIQEMVPPNCHQAGQDFSTD
jgi:hypothetical protein